MPSERNRARPPALSRAPPGYRDVLRETLAAQRARLTALRRDGKVSGEVLRALERDLDLEEARIR